jgi:hypothetical protein
MAEKNNIEQARDKVNEARDGIDWSTADSATQGVSNYREALSNLGHEIGKGSDDNGKKK